MSLIFVTSILGRTVITSYSETNFINSRQKSTKCDIKNPNYSTAENWLYTKRFHDQKALPCHCTPYSLQNMVCVPAENDILTDKTCYPGTYYPGCTVFILFLLHSFDLNWFPLRPCKCAFTTFVFTPDLRGWTKRLVRNEQQLLVYRDEKSISYTRIPPIVSLCS